MSKLLYLDLPSEDLKIQYIGKFLPQIKIRVKGELTGRDISDEAREILLPGWKGANPDETILKELLIAEPVRLKELNDELWNKLQNIKRFKRRPTKKQLNKVFDYEGLIDHSKSNSYWLAEQVGRNTCAYCNRLYTLTVVKDGGKNNSNRIVRPTFDHWYDHATYPLMSMSLFNLIPSCNVCNSSVKGTDAFDLTTHIHPYLHEAGHPKLKFVASLATADTTKWTVEIETDKGSKEAKTVADLKLNEIYAYHGELEVKDLMEFRDKYPDGYLKDLVNEILKKSSGSLTLSDVFRMLFGTEMDEAKFLDRPLSQMKYDILKDMEVI